MLSRRTLAIMMARGGAVALLTGAMGRGVAAADRGQSLEKLLQFIRVDYLGEGNTAPKASLAMYAGKVDYFDRGEITRERVLAEKQSYYNRWPRRVFEMVEGSMKPQPSGDDEVEIFFRYSFDVSNGGDSRRGIANATLRIALEDDRFVIRGEKSSVEKRF